MSANEDQHNDYLWDRSGVADLEIVRIERSLSRYRFDPARRGATQMLSGAAVPQPPRPWLRRALASAAVLLFAIAAGSIWYRQRLQWPQAQAWQITAVQGDARIDGAAIVANAQLAPDRVLETARDASVRLDVARIGEVVIGGNSRFVLDSTQSGRHRVRLQQGSLWARVWAPPGAFSVSTSVGEMLDLGCEFLLSMQPDGTGSLSVKSGWVQIDNAHRELLVPQGARVEFDSRRAPGTPYDLGANASFRAALKRIDADAGTLGADAPVLRELAGSARPQDAISLLSLLQAHPRLADGPVYSRLAEILPADTAPSRAAVRRGDAHAFNAWWNALPYPRMKRWWMQWPDVFNTSAAPDSLLQDEVN